MPKGIYCELYITREDGRDTLPRELERLVDSFQAIARSMGLVPRGRWQVEEQHPAKVLPKADEAS